MNYFPVPSWLHTLLCHTASGFHLALDLRSLSLYFIHLTHWISEKFDAVLRFDHARIQQFFRAELVLETCGIGI